MSEEIEQVHAIVSGRVQGVNFRRFTTLTARQLGITGWVRNLDDGDVEVLAEGTRAQLSQLIAFLHKGPPAAYVIGVQTTWGRASGKFETFSPDYAIF
ncbi:MAG: acylphosphatase [Anaerolineae bacterium]|nr:acylphosphatase [Anaerolineae bacterium]